MLNCDLGENEPPERTLALLDRIDAANICCGFHAGSEATTQRTIEQAKSRGLRIGAHPGLVAFGGRGVGVVSVEEFDGLMAEQLGRFQKQIAVAGARLDYVKLHGSLYHAVEADPRLAEAYLDRLREFRIGAVAALAGGRFAGAAKAVGLEVYQEAFADRGYQSDGSLVPRGQPGALIASVTEAVARVQAWRASGCMPTVDGGAIELAADTLCVHGDSPEALSLLRALAKVKD